MTPKQYKNLQTQAKEYYAFLNLADVKEEFSTSFLLNKNAKTSKGEGISIFGLELTPSTFATKENMCGEEGKCIFTCLVFSGVGNLTRAGKGVDGQNMILTPVLKKRIRRTFLFREDREFFLNRLKGEILLQKFTFGEIAIRLNVFSDVNWDVLMDLESEEFSNVIFYDYTKHKNRESTRRLTISISEKDSVSDVKNIINRGHNVAIVFHSNKLPKTWEGITVVNGDKDDRRFNDPKGVIVGLLQKITIGGKTKTSFVR
jgi:hypothetical protein